MEDYAESTPCMAGWVQRLNDSRKLLEDALSEHRCQEVARASAKLRGIWEEMAAHPPLRVVLAEVTLSNRRPDEILAGVVGRTPSSETWRIVLDARDAARDLAELLEGVQG